MNLHSGHPFWLIKNGLPYHYPKLDKDITTQVVIMGGGITGAIQAYYLAKAGIDFVVVEKRSIGLGSTCASTSLLQYQIDEPLSSLIEKVGEEHAVKAYQLCADAIIAIEKISKEINHNHFQKIPTLFFASYKKDKSLIEKEYQLHKQAGFDVELWEEKEIRKNFGFAASSALYSYHSAQIDAYDFCHNVFQYITKKGYEVYDRTEVDDIEHHKNGVRLQSADGYKIHADWLIYATGYEVTKYIEKQILRLHTTWAIVSEQFDNVQKFWKDNALIWETKMPYLYIRTTADKRIMLGGRDEAMNNPQKRAKEMKRKANKLAKDFEKLFPHYRFSPEFCWGGTFGATKDGLPYLGNYAPTPRGLFALGFGGNGITFSIIAAEILRDIILGMENPNETIFSFKR